MNVTHNTGSEFSDEQKITPINPDNQPAAHTTNQPITPHHIASATEVFLSKLKDFANDANSLHKARNEIQSNQKNTQWLYKIMKKTEGQLDKIKEIQELKSNNTPKIDDLNDFNQKFEKATLFYTELVKKIQKKIEAKPPMLFKEHARAIGPFDKLFQSIVENVNKIMVIFKYGWIFKKMNDLLGEYQTASDSSIEYLKKTLEYPELKVALELQESEQPRNHFDHLLDELTAIRDRQLKRISTNQHVLNLDDKSVMSTLSKAEGFINALKVLQSKLPEEQAQVDNIINILSLLIENAIPRNVQAITDCLYPKCVSEAKGFQAPITVGRSIGADETASKNVGSLKGFIQRNNSNLMQLAEWHSVKVKQDGDNQIFVKGFYSISLQTPDGHKTTSGAELDLSSLEQLNQKQVENIFHLATTLLSNRFELLRIDSDELSDDEEKKNAHRIK